MSNFRQNALFLIFILLTLNVLAITATGAYFLFSHLSFEKYETMDCADATGRIRKCIRIEPSAGEINDQAKNANYRVIYGY